MRIVYIENENVMVLIPTVEALKFATVEQIAEKDVPKDLPYWIVEDEDIQIDRTDRDSWEFESENEPDGFGGEGNEFDADLLENYRGIK